jgi:hypothetical protein
MMHVRKGMRRNLLRILGDKEPDTLVRATITGGGILLFIHEI